MNTRKNLGYQKWVLIADLAGWRKHLAIKKSVHSFIKLDLVIFHMWKLNDK